MNFGYSTMNSAAGLLPAELGRELEDRWIDQSAQDDRVAEPRRQGGRRSRTSPRLRDEPRA